MVKDVEGGTYPAQELFTMTIKFLYKDFMQHIKKAMSEEYDCAFVITVPDAWGDDGKKFIRMAAIKAGINNERLQLAFESEAAAIWFTIMDVNDGPKLQWPGNHYIVISQIDTVVDITINQVLPNGMAQQIHHEACGGISIKHFCLQYIDKNCGKRVLDELRIRYPNEYFDFKRYLTKKINIDAYLRNKHFSITAPMTFLEIADTCHLHRNNDKIQIPALDLGEWIEERLAILIHRVSEIRKDIQAVLLVGDIIESKYVQERFAKTMPCVNVIVSNSEDWTVVKGAVMYGHKVAAMSGIRSEDGKNIRPPNVISKRTVVIKSEISRKRFPVVAAFDFGTTYSGYTYSYESFGDNVNVNDTWRSEDSSASLNSLKTPTSVLLYPNGNFHSFGFEAEDEFARLMEENKHSGWRLFRRFKMILHNNKNLSRYTTVQDMEGKSFPALDIFSMSIRYLKKHLLDVITLQKPGRTENDIQFVITVPAIWDVGAKQFMREAAEKAGIASDQLMLAFEPEVAAVWCALHYKSDFQNLIGSKYIVIDLGGGTADITVVERKSDEEINVIHQPTGGAWGGIKVDEKFFKYIDFAFGDGVLQGLRNSNMEDYYSLIRTFENKKRSDPTSGRPTIIKLPEFLLQSYKERQQNNGEQNKSDNSQGTASVDKDKLRIESSTMKDWLEDTIRPLLEHMQTLMKHDHVKDVKTIMLVGGFAESKYVRKRIQEELTNIKLIVPLNPGLAVVKGAVVFGRNPQIFASRVIKNTYGIEVYKDFNYKKHPAEKRICVDGEWKVANCFQIFVKANDVIPVDHCVTHYLTPLASVSLISVYSSFSENPKYTTDIECSPLGMLMIENPENIPFQNQETEVTFMFGNTEIFVNVKHTETGQEERKTIDFLSS